MKIVDTYTANIFMGLKEGYDGKTHSYIDAEMWLQDYCDKKGFAVTLTETEFIYTGGNEPGIIVGLINYPRFPSTPEEIFNKAIEIGTALMYKFNQQRFSIVCIDKTVMIENVN